MENLESYKNEKFNMYTYIYQHMKYKSDFVECIF